MEELMNVVQEKIKIMDANISRNKKYFDYPFTSNCNHYYKLILLHSQAECWEQFLKLLVKFNSERKLDFHKKCDDFEKKLSFEKSVAPGFVTQKTLAQMIEYMRTLEWKVEELVRVKSQNYDESC
ncbi:hypothetical protein QFZ81_003616 [Paenibacillus sp. V4I9]|uniref:hypothetical protein n=1 Tax=Paenibacillus sp. V4I9 TaxID=3042308 RepID=UPI0027836DB2|nr:hypothetical protein [Paenibacillus sp. V4I9]MDQ0888528.1 hypothetical protein [Paenibacillus sp. V4I9]